MTVINNVKYDQQPEEYSDCNVKYDRQPKDNSD